MGSNLHTKEHIIIITAIRNDNAGSKDSNASPLDEVESGLEKSAICPWRREISCSAKVVKESGGHVSQTIGLGPFLCN